MQGIDRDIHGSFKHSMIFDPHCPMQDPCGKARSPARRRGSPFLVLDICPRKTVFTTSPIRFPFGSVIGRFRRSFVSISSMTSIVGVSAYASGSKRNVGNRRFNAQDKGRPFDIELGESAFRLGVRPAACSDIGVLPVSVQKCGIPIALHILSVSG